MPTINGQHAVRRAQNLCAAAFRGDFTRADFDWAEKLLARDERNTADPLCAALVNDILQELTVIRRQVGAL